MINRRAFMVTAMAAMTAGRSAGGATGYFAPAEEAPHARTWLCWASTPSIYGASRAYFEDLQESLGRLAAVDVATRRKRPRRRELGIEDRAAPGAVPVGIAVAVGDAGEA